MAHIFSEGFEHSTVHRDSVQSSSNKYNFRITEADISSNRPRAVDHDQLYIIMGRRKRRPENFASEILLQTYAPECETIILANLHK